MCVCISAISIPAKYSNPHLNSKFINCRKRSGIVTLAHSRPRQGSWSRLRIRWLGTSWILRQRLRQGKQWFWQVGTEHRRAAPAFVARTCPDSYVPHPGLKTAQLLIFLETERIFQMESHSRAHHEHLSVETPFVFVGDWTCFLVFSGTIRATSSIFPLPIPKLI